MGQTKPLSRNVVRRNLRRLNLHSSALPAELPAHGNWCLGQESNLHALRHLLLRQACLPFHHRGLKWCPEQDSNLYALRRLLLKQVCLPFHHQGDFQVMPRAGFEPASHAAPELKAGVSTSSTIGAYLLVWLPRQVSNLRPPD